MRYLVQTFQINIKKEELSFVKKLYRKVFYSVSIGLFSAYTVRVLLTVGISDIPVQEEGERFFGPKYRPLFPMIISKFFFYIYCIETFLFFSRNIAKLPSLMSKLKVAFESGAL